jgi:hypothetical protein
MPRIYHFDPILGRTKNSGLYTAEPKHPDDFGTVLFEPGDSALFRADETHGPIVVTRSGAPGAHITLDTYVVPGTKTRWARMKADSSATRPISIEVNASYITVNHLAAVDARYAGYMVRERQGYIVISQPRVRHSGMGMRLRGSYITVLKADIQDLVMSRDEGLVTDEGAVAFNLEAQGWVNEGNVIDGAFVRGAVAPSKNGRDGGGYEGFGAVINAVIRNSIFQWCKGFAEIGGPPVPPGGVPQTTRDVLFENNLILDCGIVALFNDPAKNFPIRVKNMQFRHNTVVERSRNLSAVFFNGSWGSLADVVSFDDNIYSGYGTFVGTGGVTDLKSIARRGNVYQRMNTASRELGYPLSVGEVLADPQFSDSAALDYRVLPTSPAVSYPELDAAMSLDAETPFEPLMPSVAGALGIADPALRAQAYDAFRRNPYQVSANMRKGGHHSGPRHTDMWTLDTDLREAHMMYTVEDQGLRYRLDPDLKTWWPEG